MTTAPDPCPAQAAARQTAHVLPHLLWQAVPACSSTGARAARERAFAHKQRCRQLLPMSAREADTLVAQFLASRGGATRCPPAYAAPVR